MFKGNGKEIRNPAAFLASVPAGNSIPGGLFDAHGEEIRDPAAHVRALSTSHVAKGVSGKPAGVKGVGALVAKPFGKGVHNGAPLHRAIGAQESEIPGPGIMFKSDGKEIRNPVAFVSKIPAGGYEGGLFDADGMEIANPAEFVAAHQEHGLLASLPASRSNAPTAGKAHGKQSVGSIISGKAGGKGKEGPGLLFKKDGTEIRNPKAFIDRIPPGSYEGGLFDVDGHEVANPQEYLFRLEQGGHLTAPRPTQGEMSFPSFQLEQRGEKRKDMHASHGSEAPSQLVLFKKDGTQLRDPVAFIQRIKDYTGGLYNAQGEEILDPFQYLADSRAIVPAHKVARIEYGGPNSFKGAGGKSAPSNAGGLGKAAGKDKSGPGVLFKQDGTEIRNPDRFLAHLEDYKGGLFDSKGNEIRNPARWLEALEQRTGGKAQGKDKTGPGVLFKADGTEIRKPDRFIAQLDNYAGGLYDASGVEIEDPARYLEKLDTMDLRPVAPKGGLGKGPGKDLEGPGVLFKADGTEIRKPARFIAHLKEYTGGLFDANGLEIADPVGYVESLDLPPEEPSVSAAMEGKGGAGKGKGGPGVLFKGAGKVEIRNPVAFVAGLKKYQGGLFDGNGIELADPLAYVEELVACGALEGKGGKGGNVHLL